MRIQEATREKSRNCGLRDWENFKIGSLRKNLGTGDQWHSAATDSFLPGKEQKHFLICQIGAMTTCCWPSGSELNLCWWGEFWVQEQGQGYLSAKKSGKREEAIYWCCGHLAHFLLFLLEVFSYVLQLRDIRTFSNRAYSYY